MFRPRSTKKNSLDAARGHNPYSPPMSDAPVGRGAYRRKLADPLFSSTRELHLLTRSSKAGIKSNSELTKLERLVILLNQAIMLSSARQHSHGVKLFRRWLEMSPAAKSRLKSRLTKQWKKRRKSIGRK